MADNLTPCKRSKPTDLNWDVTDPEESEALSNENLMKQMQAEMQKSQSNQDKSRIKDLLTQTYGFRRDLFNSSNSIDIVKEKYPALFTEDGILLEYELLTGSKNVKKCVRTFLKELNQVTQHAGSKNGKRQSKIVEILHSMNEAMEEEGEPAGDDLNREQYLKAVAGIFILPHLLGEDCQLLLRTYPVSCSFMLSSSLFLSKN